MSDEVMVPPLLWLAISQRRYSPSRLLASKRAAVRFAVFGNAARSGDARRARRGMHAGGCTLDLNARPECCACTLGRQVEKRKRDALAPLCLDALQAHVRVLIQQLVRDDKEALLDDAEREAMLDEQDPDWDVRDLPGDS